MRTCPRCGGHFWWYLTSGQRHCKACGLTRKKPLLTWWGHTKLFPYHKGKLLEYFILGVPAYRLRLYVSLSLKTIRRWYRTFRTAIYQQALIELEQLSGTIELDETMFGGRFPGKRGWGAYGKHLVFGMYKRNGHVITFPISSRSFTSLAPIITQHTKAGSLYYTDDWFAYTFLPIRGNHVVVRKEKGRPKGRDHINGIEGFWSYAKHWLYPYRGIPKDQFHLYLKEAEWRFNHRDENLMLVLRRLLNQRIVKEQ